MPTNLPPAYFEVEKRLKAASSAAEKIPILEEMLGIIPKHKGTEKLRATLKTKLSKLKSSAQKKSSAARHSAAHKVPASGAGQIVVIGAPNSGKSHLINTLAGSELAVAEYPFTTLEPAPVMMKYKDIQIQLVDTPPVTRDYMESWYPDLVRAADRILLLVNLAAADPAESYRMVTERLAKVGITVGLKKSSPQDEREENLMPGMLAATQSDRLKDEPTLQRLQEAIPAGSRLQTVSAETGEGVSELADALYDYLEIIRVYSKIPGKPADMNAPFTLARGSTVMDMARAVHRDFTEKLKFARIWSQTTYQGQRVNRHHVLEDEDIIELHIP